jgi:hypothetical protein
MRKPRLARAYTADQLISVDRISAWTEGDDTMALKRSKLKKSQFGQPSKRKYPMPDKKHAANAKGRAKQQLKKGKLSRAAYDKIIAKANRVLKRAKTKKREQKPKTS